MKVEQKHIQLVKWMANKYHKTFNIDVDAAIDAGMEALVRAEQNWTEGGASFNNYCGRLIYKAFCSEQQIRKAKKRPQDVVSLDITYDDGDNKLNPSHTYDYSAKLIAEEAMSKLNPRDRKIVFHRIWYRETFTEISKVMGMSRQECCVLHNKAIEKLRRIYK